MLCDFCYVWFFVWVGSDVVLSFGRFVVGYGVVVVVGVVVGCVVGLFVVLWLFV